MNLTKSYKLINTLNKDYGFFVNHFFFFSSYIVIFAVSVNTKIAYSVAREFLRKDYKTAFRSGAWVVRKRFPSIGIIEDNFFDFTGNLELDECDAYSDFIRANRKQARSPALLTDELYILARKIHLNIENSSDRNVILKLVAEFYELAQTCLDSASVDKKVERNNDSTAVERVGDFSRVDAVNALKDFAELFPIERFPWYVVSGTFLGLHREGGFLSHDYDIDLGINEEQFNKEVVCKLLMNSESFVIRKFDYHVEVVRDSECFTIRRSPALIKLVHRSGLNVDLFIHHRSGDHLWHGSVIHKWINKNFGVVERSLEGIRVLAPDDPDVYLTENYGQWSIPVTEFDCTTGTPNLMITRNFLSISLFIKKLIYLYETDYQSAEKLKEALVRSDLVDEDSNGLLTVNHGFL